VAETYAKRLALVASIFTALGYLSAFAVELSVGSRFLAGLIQGISPLVTVVVMSLISFIYTGLGGFRVAVVTDRVQMWFIWLLPTGADLSGLQGTPLAPRRDP
jgi:Na+/pantothenate symporter